MVHVYTASGTVLAMLTVIAVLEGETVRALWLGLAAMVVDGTDGMLARHLEVKRWVPWFDGALLDNIVDYLTYAFTPMVLLWSTGYLGDGTSATLLSVMPLLASAYQFCRVDAKTEDHLFLGFPSYWNVVAFYVIVLDLEPTAVAVLLTVCAALVFIPVGYVYPSRTEHVARADAGPDDLVAGQLRGAPVPAPLAEHRLVDDLARLRRLLRGPEPAPHRASDAAAPRQGVRLTRRSAAMEPITAPADGSSRTSTRRPRADPLGPGPDGVLERQEVRLLAREHRVVKDVSPRSAVTGITPQ